MSTTGGDVLVVEDKENMLEMVRQILAVHHDVATAVDGASALALLESRAFDVVLTCGFRRIVNAGIGAS